MEGQKGQILDGEAANEQFGYSVAMAKNGTIMAVGARGANNFAGAVRVYELANDMWTQLGGDIDGEAVGDAFGFSVSLSADGTRVAVGAPFNDDSGQQSGSVRVLELANDMWTQLGGDIDGEAAFDDSGFSVSLSANGDRVAVGAPGNNDGGSSAGSVRVYEITGTTWTQLGGDIDGEATGDNS